MFSALFNNCNLFFSQAVQFINHPVDFGFKDAAASIFSVVNNKVGSSFGIDIVVWDVIGIFQEFSDDVFMEFLRLRFIYPVEKIREILLKKFNLRPVGLHLQEGFIERFTGIDDDEIHVIHG